MLCYTSLALKNIFSNIKMEYKESKCIAKLYPSLPPVAVPSAPPEPTSDEGTAQSYRLQKINEIQKEIATERDKRATCLKSITEQ